MSDHVTDLFDQIFRIVSATEFGADHGWNHSLLVAKGTEKYLGLVGERWRQIANIAALSHDIADSKIEGWEARWKSFQATLRDHVSDETARIIVWIIENIGVSREAGKQYDQPGWTAKKWEAECKKALPYLPIEEITMVIKCRHAVSAADMLTALGKAGHERAVMFNMRKQGIKFGEEMTPEQKTNLIEDVRWIHEVKHRKMQNWIHLESAREDIDQGIRELFEEFERWVAEI
jgi:hypothetical protein